MTLPVCRMKPASEPTKRYRISFHMLNTKSKSISLFILVSLCDSHEYLNSGVHLHICILGCSRFLPNSSTE